MSPSSVQRRTVHYTGHVQGVGFRYNVVSVAQRFAVTGFVQNLPDRRVLLVAEGMPAELDGLLAAVAERMENHIRSVQVDITAASGEFFRFEIRH
ncbi:MAG TPA: acylphosphatase [Pirellulaceae bacterium]|nr:acylphosphatase [Pirellulaceae bacterium]